MNRNTLRSLPLFLFLASAALAEDVETVPIMAGTPHYNTCTIKHGDSPGPGVFIIGGMHGDEVAGYMAARQMLSWTVTTGTLILIPDSHITAIRAGKREWPANMNKQFPGKPDGTPMQRAAWEMWSLIKQHRPALLVTLHEGLGWHRDGTGSFGQTLTYDFKELTPTFAPVLHEINAQLPASQRFYPYLWPCRGCPTDCAWRFLKIPAVTIETSRAMKLPERIRQQLLVCRILMRRYGLEWTEPPAKQSAAEPRLILCANTQEAGAPASLDMAAAKRHVAYLAGTIGPRAAGSAAESKALDYCRQQFAAMGLTPHVQSVPIWSGKKSANVSASLPGGSTEIILGAHVDSVPWSPGANDNAAGVAAVLELARYFKHHPAKQTLTFVVFGAEEGRYDQGKFIDGWGRAGSKAYAQHLSAARAKSVRLMLNFDQVAGGPSLRAGDMTAKGGPAVQTCLKLARTLGIKLTQTTFRGKSDYRFFRERGIPIVAFDCGEDPLTHKAGDVPGKLRYEKLQSIMRAAVAMVERR